MQRTVTASRELLAPRRDVWAFVAEPHNLPNWWPKVGGVVPDRRGLGTRCELRRRISVERPWKSGRLRTVDSTT